MATNITAEWSGSGPDGRTTTISKAAISVADQVVNTTTNNSGGWNTATVTADVARTLVLGAADGVPPGRYEKTVTGTFRKAG